MDGRTVQPAVDIILPTDRPTTACSERHGKRATDRTSLETSAVPAVSAVDTATVDAYTKKSARLRSVSA